MHVETLNLIFLGCGKAARRMESCDEHMGAAEKRDDASEWSQGGSGCPRGRWKHPSPAAGEGPVAERSWTCQPPGFPVVPTAMDGGVCVAGYAKVSPEHQRSLVWPSESMADCVEISLQW